MNYGEKISYWYLRLNGFFLLENLVTHRTALNRYASDIDLLGIRLPYVFEEVGGRADDWHNVLMENLNPEIPTGVICEVKTGGLEDNEIFKPQYIRYAVDRFGFMPGLSQHYEQISTQMVSNFDFNGSRFQVIKIFISNQESDRTDILKLNLQDVRQF